MTFLSEMERPRPRTTHTHYFQSEKTALEHLKAYSIEPDGKKFVMICERNYSDKSFDALDYLMYDHSYQVNWI